MPGATVETGAGGINDRGQIVGARLAPDGTGRGFMLERGRYTFFAPPGAVLTLPFDINNRGLIVGAYQNATAAPGPTHNSSSPVAMPTGLLRRSAR